MNSSVHGGNWYRGTANWIENRMNETLAEDEPHDDRQMMRDAMNKLNQAADEVDRLRHVEQLAKRFAKAKGRFHSQQAACDLMDHFGVPCVRPETKMQKPRIREVEVYGQRRWHCRGGPMLHGEYYTGHGDTPREAWFDFLRRVGDHLMAETSPPDTWMQRFTNWITR